MTNANGGGSNPGSGSDPENESEEEIFWQESGFNGSFRIEFKGWLDTSGNGRGRITSFNLKNDLEEVALSGLFENGLLCGKVKLEMIYLFPQWVTEKSIVINFVSNTCEIHSFRISSTSEK
jgi:hypothetical protein